MVEAPRVGRLTEEGQVAAKQLFADITKTSSRVYKLDGELSLEMFLGTDECLWVVPARTSVWIYPKMVMLQFWLGEGSNVELAFVMSDGAVHTEAPDSMKLDEKP